MPTFTYVARNPQGKVVTGRTEAATQGMVVKVLKDQGLTPTAIQLATATAETRTAAKQPITPMCWRWCSRVARASG